MSVQNNDNSRSKSNENVQVVFLASFTCSGSTEPKCEMKKESEREREGCKTRVGPGES